MAIHSAKSKHTQEAPANTTATTQATGPVEDEPADETGNVCNPRIESCGINQAIIVGLGRLE